ncbi:MAG: 5-(carboxyamino)imidazole ribonucleotide mutase [Proteobacteria bacterium]|nr:5-(carboxyamino)imidazole ribonucleotide mutase [Pseudomonadota bacterium]
MSEKKPLVSVLMGSQSDWPVMKKAVDILDQFGIANEVKIISAHRKNARLQEYVSGAEKQGVRVFIAGAGMAAHLPGVVATLTTLPVIGVPLAASLEGVDSFLAIVQMPPGIPVATVAIDGAKNAGILAAEILSVGDHELKLKIVTWRKTQADALSENPR